MLVIKYGFLAKSSLLTLPSHLNCKFVIIFLPFQAELFDLKPQHFLPNLTNETFVQDWEPETSSKLSLIIDDTIITTGNLKIKCVVDSFGLYHKSNEVSIETFGLKPTPKSVQMQPQTASEVIEEIEVQSRSGTLRKLNLFLSNLLLLLIAAVQ